MEILPTDPVYKFQSAEHKLQKFVLWKLATKKTKKPKESFLYKGFLVEHPQVCKIIGYIDDFSVVIELATGIKHVIHPSYLREMQKKSFKRNSESKESN